MLYLSQGVTSWGNAGKIGRVNRSHTCSVLVAIFQVNEVVSAVIFSRLWYIHSAAAVSTGYYLVDPCHRGKQ